MAIIEKHFLSNFSSFLSPASWFFSQIRCNHWIFVTSNWFQRSKFFRALPPISSYPNVVIGHPEVIFHWIPVKSIREWHFLKSVWAYESSYSFFPVLTPLLRRIFSSLLLTPLSEVIFSSYLKKKKAWSCNFRPFRELPAISGSPLSTSILCHGFRLVARSDV